MGFQFDRLQFDRMFPFYILIDKDLKITGTGSSLEKIFPDAFGSGFDDKFSIPRPVTNEITFEILKDLRGQLIILSCNNENNTSLRGQIELLNDTQELIFIGSPWFASMEQVIENNLTLNDFAYHDPLIDLLHVIKTNEITTDDLKQLLNTVNRQKKELKEANLEIHEIALFPTQNPDPLIRINLEGKLLRRNPAAEKLKNFTYKGNNYTSEELFEHIAPLIGINEERWIFEASSGDKVYSFVCRAMNNDGYINIYGRNVTKIKKSQEELNRLSLIIHETNNAVIVTDADGKVEWVNHAFYKVTGFTLEDVKGKKPGSVLQGPKTDQETVKYIRKQLQEEKAFTCEIYNYKKTGGGYWLRINAQPIRDEEGKTTHFFAIEEDITFEREAQNKLRSAASRMSLLITSLNAGILLENERRTIELINNRFCELFNIPVEPAMLIGTDCSQSAEQSKHMFKDPESFIERINFIVKQRKEVIGDMLELVDGRCFTRDFVPIFNNERYEGHLWVYTDITEKLLADKKLNEQREFYEKILDNIPADIAVFDKDQRYLYVNPKGINDPKLRTSIVGKTEEDYFSLVNKDPSILKVRRSQFGEVMKTGKLKSWEEKVERPDGTYSHVLLNFFPVLKNNKDVDLVIGYGVDITKIKNIQKQIEQSEKRYRDVIENSLAIITTHDLEGRFLTINPMVSKTFGYKDHEILGHNIFDFMPDEDKKHFHKGYMSEIIKNKKHSGLFKIIHKDGHIVHTLFNNFLKEEPGIDPYVIGFAVDITERVNAEKELEIAKKTTEQLAQTKQNFLANMSHEIRTPMNAIMGMANQLLKTSLDKDQLFYLDIIQSATNNLLVIINDILDLSKIEAGKLIIESIGFELSSVIDRTIHVMRPKAEEKGLTLTNTVFDTEISKVLIGDPFRLNQILLNLLSNAIKFTEKGGVDIHCQISKNNDYEQTIRISIIDSGIGMGKEFVKNLFQKFSQEDESVTRKYGGTGLGMNITREILELMDGTIEVESEKNKGTCVAFTITLKKGNKDDLPEPEKLTVNTSVLAGKKILVTDDNKMNRLVVSTILANHDVKIIEAENGKEAIDLMKEQLFDVVLMDVQMPVMDGLEATKYIRKHISKEVPIIALTAYAIKGDDRRFLDAGMNEYLSKPFEENQLLKIIGNILGEDHIEISGKKSEEKSYSEDKLYSLSKIESIARGDKEFVEKMINLFIDQVTISVDEIKEAFDLNDFEKIKKVVHRTKPSILNLGISSLNDEQEELQYTDWDDSKKDDLKNTLDKYIATVLKVVEQLKTKFIISNSSDSDPDVTFTEIRSGKEPGSDDENHTKESSISNEARILLAEDNEIIQEIVKRLLEDMGLVVDIANNGKIAIDMLKESKYDLIFMDLQMPVMDGYMACSEIRKIKELDDLPIIALTADALNSEFEKCIRAGMQGFIVKPVNADQIFEIIIKYTNIEVLKPSKTYKSNYERHDESIFPDGLPVIEGLNTELALNMLNRDKQLYVNILNKFLKNYRDFTKDLSSLMKEKDYKSAKRSVHTLKGITGTIGAEELHNFINQVEQILLEKDYDKFTNQISELDTRLNNVFDSIKRSLPAISNKDKIKTSLQITEILDQLDKALSEQSPEANRLITLLEGSEFEDEHLNELKEAVFSYNFDEAKKVIDKIRI